MKTKKLNTEAYNLKELFDLCEKIGERVHNKLHIIEFPQIGQDAEHSFRVYHADGYCFTIRKDYYEPADDEINDSAIDNWEYQLEDHFEGFKSLSTKEYIELLKSYNV